MIALAEVQKSIISDLLVTLLTCSKDGQNERDFSHNFKQMLAQTEYKPL